MLAYLDKTFSLFNHNDTCCIAWNGRAGWLAIGGSEGLLRIVDLNNINYYAKQHETECEINHDDITMQSLDGHSGTVTHLAWNEIFQKLASTDKEGLTIVWSLHNDGEWCQDMVNNQNHSYVTDMKWSNDGELIAIIYENGTVIVGSVEGNKLWGLELDHVPSLRCVEWSPSNNSLVFITEHSMMKVYDKMGNHIKDVSSYTGEICDVHWHDSGKSDSPRTTIYSINGQINLVSSIYQAGTKGTTIESNVVDGGKCLWSPDGTMLAVCGKTMRSETTHKTLAAKFYDLSGNYIFMYEFPQGENIVDIEWDYSSLRIAIATTKTIYILNVRPDFVWTTFNVNSTMVYKSLESETVYFSNQSSGRIREKSFGNIRTIHGGDKYCVLFTTLFDDAKNQGFTTANICDEIGTVVSAKEIPIEPNQVSINNRVLVVTDYRNVYMYIFNSMTQKVDLPTFHSDLYRNANGMERMFDIHDSSINPSKPKSTYVINKEEISPRITAVLVTRDLILVSKESNEVVFFTYPNITRLNQVLLQTNVPRTIQTNCDFTKFSFTDADEALHIYDIRNADSKITLSPQLYDHNLHSVWAVKWSVDDPFKCVILEHKKITELHCHHQIVEQYEHLIQSDHLYLMHYSNLETKLANLYEIMLNPLFSPKLGSSLVHIPAKDVKDVESQKEEFYFEEASMKASNVNKDILKVIGRKSLAKRDFSSAIRAFVQSKDYHSITFTDRISSQQQESLLQEAEIMMFNGRFKQAEELYLGKKRYDLATRMYINTGDWTNAMRLLEMGKFEGNALHELYTTVAENLFNQRQYAEAFTYYKKAQIDDKAILSLIRCRDYKALKSFVEGLLSPIPDNKKKTLLQKLTNMFIQHGIYDLAFTCQSKISIEAAIEVMIRSNQWEKAIHFTKDNIEMNTKVMKTIREKSQVMLQSHNYLDAIELCQFTGMASNAAQAILSFHERLMKLNKSTPLYIRKKLFVLAAMHVDIYQKKEIDLSQLQLRGGNQSSNIATSIEKILDVEYTNDLSTKTKKQFRKIWRHAAAYHYLQLAQEKLYDGNLEIAMKAGIRCCEYSDILDAVTVYSLVAIASFQSKYYLACSICFSKLITMKTLDDNNLIKSFKKLGYAIFTKNEPIDKYVLPQCYIDCLEMGKRYEACTITGSNIANKLALQCKHCGHYMLEEVAMHKSNCPLCHQDCTDAESVTILDEAYEG